MTPEQFEQACISLKDYFGTVGVFGGNPAVSPHFEAYCEIIKKHIPFDRRGLWCNNPLGKGKIMAATFNPRVSNLNVHLDKKAYREFKQDWPQSLPFGLDKDSRHSPVFVAMKDVVKRVCEKCGGEPVKPRLIDDGCGGLVGGVSSCGRCQGSGQVVDEEKCWDLISNCDINQHWSAMIGLFRGELRGWFCEIAGAQSILHQDDPEYPDTGLPLRMEEERGEVMWWWQVPMQGFTSQVRKHCFDCGVPLRGYGELACSTDPDSKEQCSQTHAGIYRPKKKDRKVEVVELLDQLSSKDLKFTQYLQGADK